MRSSGLSALAIGLIAFACPPASAAAPQNPADPDTAFSGDGRQTLDYGAIEEIGGAREMAIGADDSVTTIGNADLGENESAVTVTRLTELGAPDPGFGWDGRVVVRFPGAASVTASDVDLQEDGGMIVAGTAYLPSGGSRFAVARLLPDGRPDPAFSGDGRVVTTVPGYAAAVAALPGGVVALAGSSYASGEPPLGLIRLRADGELDPAFDDDGIFTFAFSEQFPTNEVVDLEVEGDGDLLVAGKVSRMLDHRFAAARISGGDLDSSFSGDGVAIVQLSKFSVTEGSDLQADGKLVIAGRGETPKGSEGFLPSGIAVARFRLDGELDPEFSEDGRQVVAPGDRSNGLAPADVAASPDGSLFVGGAALSGSFNFGVAALRPDGSLDTGFSGDGWAGPRTAESPGLMHGEATAVGVDGEGRIVLAGEQRHSFDRTNEIGVMRLLGATASGACAGVPATILGTTDADELVGTATRDVIVAHGGDDRISAGGGNDLICGGDGADRIAAEAGNDTGRGGAGADRLFGDDGRDRLFGDRQNDFIAGGSGADHLRGGQGRDRLRGGPGRDRLDSGPGQDSERQ